MGFHEPLLLSGVSNAAGIRTHRAALIEEGRSRIRAATEDFLLGVVGKETYESLDPDLRERLLRNGDVLLNIETMPCLDYEPTATELASVRVPVLVIASANNCHVNAPGYWRYQAAAHLASQLGAPLVELPGMHTSYLAQPRVFAEALRPHLATLT